MVFNDAGVLERLRELKNENKIMHLLNYCK